MSAAKGRSVKTMKTEEVDLMMSWRNVGSWESVSSLLNNHQCNWKSI